MGIFSPRQSAYTPPFDGTNPRTTLVGQDRWRPLGTRTSRSRHDPAYEIGGDGGQIQNRNSVAYTLGRAMGLDLDRALPNAGAERRFSGWGRDLLAPNYDRYIAPPPLAVRDSP